MKKEKKLTLGKVQIETRLKGSMWEVSIGPAYQQGWNRSREPAPEAYQCRHCLSYQSTFWLLEKEIQAFGSVVWKYAKVHECENCGNEVWEMVEGEKKSKQQDPEVSVRLKQWKSLSPEVQDFLLGQLEKERRK